ncbi:serine peptidase, partial [Xanthomonas perforans]|nr:serine peptidase [Xanthomonas perforans]
MATGKPPRSKPARALPRKAAASTQQPARPRASRAQQAGTQESAATRVQAKARTVIYIHGIGNKPPADVLRCQWDKALFGRPMGERTRLAYWVNRERYP